VNVCVRGWEEAVVIVLPGVPVDGNPVIAAILMACLDVILRSAVMLTIFCSWW
jgi:hypothetical protein